jgi:two-component system, NtrC family, sensor histidine kinase HydH
MAIRNMYTLFCAVVRIASSSSLSYEARLKLLTEHINQSFLAESTVVYLLNDEGSFLAQKVPFADHQEILACSIPLGQGVAGLCAATRQVVSRKYQDLHQDEIFAEAGQSIHSFPIVDDKDIYGVISLGFKSDDAISAHEKVALQNVCAMLAGLIQNWKSTGNSGMLGCNPAVHNEYASNRQITDLAAEHDRKQKELLLLYSISNTMHSTINLNELIYMILKAVVAGMTPIFERAMLFLVNERSGVIQGMQGVASDPSLVNKDMKADEILNSGCLEISEDEVARQKDSAFSRMVKETRMPLDKSLNVYSRAVLDKKLYFISDAANEGQEERDFSERFGVKAFAAVPLQVKGEAVGLVIVDNPLTDRIISRDDLLFLQLLMNQAGTAIENSMLQIRIEDAHRDFREIQQRLIQGEKLAAIGEMAASIAHELKGPLVSIGGFAKRLERKFVPGSVERKYSETIVHEVSRLEKMLTDTLFFSKKATICYAPCNINSIVEDSLAVLATTLEEKKIRIRLRLYSKIASFLGDCQQLKQVFINLFSNAADAMKESGTLSITVAPTKLDGDNALSVTVSDTGGGIPVEILNDIFNPFFTTKECGTGLGLPISHRIVSNHGGRILVHNRPGIGAQFKVILPTHQCLPTQE